VARIEVPMPQMGESIAEGTVSKWLKQVGETVERDEPILEISTDKVDAEIPAPSPGTLVEIVVAEGDTVEVGAVVAYIDPEGGAPAARGGGAEERPQAAAPSADPGSGVAGEPAAVTERPSADTAEAAGGEASAEERLRTRSTPVVRKIAEEHGIDIASVPGTGHAGRVTKQDILDFMGSGTGRSAPIAEAGALAPEPAATKPVQPGAAGGPAAPAAAVTAPSDLWKRFYGEVQNPEFPVRDADRVEPMDKIRRITAEHMVVAKRTPRAFVHRDRLHRGRRDPQRQQEEMGGPRREDQLHRVRRMGRVPRPA